MHGAGFLNFHIDTVLPSPCLLVEDVEDVKNRRLNSGRYSNNHNKSLKCESAMRHFIKKNRPTTALPSQLSQPHPELAISMGAGLTWKSQHGGRAHLEKST